MACISRIAYARALAPKAVAGCVAFVWATSRRPQTLPLPRRRVVVPELSLRRVRDSTPEPQLRSWELHRGPARLRVLDPLESGLYVRLHQHLRTLSITISDRIEDGAVFVGFLVPAGPRVPERYNT